MTTEIETVTGRLVNIENPDPTTINIEDIAWGLSRLPRFCGHTITVIPYNVAQHSMFVADEVALILAHNKSFTSNQVKRIVKLAQLHDAAEVYTGDWPSPVKRVAKLRPIIKQLEAGLMAAVYKAMDLEPPTEAEEKIIKQADMIAQKIEAHAFMPSRGKHWPNMPEVSLERLQQFSEPLDSLTSYRLFMEKFNSLR